MKLFQERELQAAYEYARAGGQALHLFSGAGALYPNAPKCFKKHKEAAHLFDYDKYRLKRTVRKLGVQEIRVGRLGQQGQHIDLCGKPLQRAKENCDGFQQSQFACEPD